MSTEQRLREEFDAVVSHLEQMRRADNPTITYTSGFYADIADTVFNTAMLALKEAWDQNQRIIGPQQAQQSSQPPRLHVISAPAGSGKTTFAEAFMVAVERCKSDIGLSDCGSLYVVNEITKADEAYQHLNALLPGRVAVWTHEHDPNCRTPPENRRLLEPAARFTKDQLQDYPVVIITHAFYTGKDSRKATHFRLKAGRELRPRLLTVIDERVDGVTVYDVALSAAQKLREAIDADKGLGRPRAPTWKPSSISCGCEARTRRPSRRQSTPLKLGAQQGQNTSAGSPLRPPPPS